MRARDLLLSSRNLLMLLSSNVSPTAECTASISGMAAQCRNSGCLANVESLGGWGEESLLVSGRSMLSLVSVILRTLREEIQITKSPDNEKGDPNVYSNSDIRSLVATNSVEGKQY